MAKSANRETAIQVREAVSQVIATDRFSREAIHACADRAGLRGDNQRRLKKALLSVGEEYVRDGHLGRMGATVLLAEVLWGDDFLKYLERAKLFVCDVTNLQKQIRFLKDFSRKLATYGDEWSALRDRLDTYEAYAALLKATTDQFARLRSEGGKPLRFWTTRLLALTELCFLNAYFQTSVSDLHRAWFESFRSPEDLAEAVSTVFAIANDRRELDAIDFSLPTVENLTDPYLFQLLNAGRVVNEVRDVEKHISLVQYRLQRKPGNGCTAWILNPPYPDFEATLRIGYIRAEVGRDKAPLDIAGRDDQTSITMPGMAERFVGSMGEKLVEVRDDGTPFRRLRILLPYDAKIQGILDSVAYYEDQWEEESLSQDLVFPMRLNEAEELRLTDHLTLHEFIKGYRFLRFFAFVNIAALRPYAKTDRTVFLNSLVRIATQESLLELLGQVSGLARESALDLLHLISADSAALGYFDLQYRPLFKYRRVVLPEIPEPPHEYAFAPFLLAMSNMLRNVRMSNKMRFRDDGKIFVITVAASLRRRFTHVVTERNLQVGQQRTDLDVVVLEGNNLFLFECKHSLPPTGMHETRDLWQDIEDGIDQLSTAKAIFADKMRMTDFLAGWFPGMTRRRAAGLTIRYCVLSSHRLFSGLQIGDVAIRDYASLNRVLADGTLGMGMAGEDGRVMTEFNVWRENTFCADELVRYLSRDSPFHRSFDPFLIPFSKYERFGHVVVARETILYTLSLDDWITHMIALGCRRLTDRTVAPAFPEDLDQLRTKIATQHRDPGLEDC